MTLTVSITEDDVFVALRKYILACAPSLEVIKAQGNRVSEPSQEDFAVMTPMDRDRLSTNISEYSKIAASRAITQQTDFFIQLDIHGPNSGDNSQIISTLFRDEFGIDVFAASNPNITPLFADNPKQIPFINAEQQYEYRWVIDAHIQFNPTITNKQDFANSAVINVINVDATYPPQN